MFIPDQLMQMPWHDMRKFVRDAERALFPNTHARRTASLWLDLIEYERRDCGSLAVLSKTQEARIAFMWSKSKNGLVRLMSSSAEIKAKDLAMAEAYNLEEALFSEDDQPFETAYRQLRVLMELYVDVPKMTMEEVLVARKPRRPMPADFPADILARARRAQLQKETSRAIQGMTLADRVVTSMAKHMVALR